MQPLSLVALPAFADNYIWMLHDGVQAVVVDPGDAAPVIDALGKFKLELASILVTHHHGDHVGGVDALRSRLSGVVHAPATEIIPEPHIKHREGDAFACLGARVRVIDVPGHTAGHIAYVVQVPDQADILFCGDTLFSAGCGRLFEGTPAQMLSSLNKLKQLDERTRVCCAHEYTLSNLRFALAVDPTNEDAVAHHQRCVSTRERGEFTLPSTIGLEGRINPFLRSHLPPVAASVKAHQAAQAGQASLDADDPVALFAALRQWKNTFQ